MAEQRHQCLQRHPGVDQGGGICVPELVRGHVAEAGGSRRRGRVRRAARAGTAAARDG